MSEDHTYSNTSASAHRWLIGFMLILCFHLIAITSSATAGPLIEWNEQTASVTADVDGAPIEKVLKSIADSTNWEIFVEPDLKHHVYTKFEKVDSGEALRRLIKPLNYALVPTPEGKTSLYIFSSNRTSATKKIESGSENRIGDELVVTLGDDVDAEDLAKKLGAKVIGGIDGKGIYRLKFPDEGIADSAYDRLESMDDVDTDYNYNIPKPPTPVASPEITAFPIDLNPAPLSDDEGIIVAIIDTAVQNAGSPFGDFLLDQLSVVGETVNNSINPTHGTHVLDALFTGVAASTDNTETIIRVLPVDVYGVNDSTTTYDLTAGTSLAVENGATVINISSGGTDTADYFSTLLSNLSDSGIAVVAAAGNNGSSQTIFPAGYEDVISVTAVTSNGSLATYANTSPTVDAAGPGANAAEFAGRVFVSEGTSVAAPHISGAIASGLEAGLSAQQASQVVVEASPVPSTGN